MFFASILQKLPLETPIEDAEKYLADHKAFESFRDGCLNHLLKVAKEKNETMYPWTENDIKRGALELVYQQELQTCTNTEFKNIHEDVVVTLRGFGLDSLRTNHPPIKALRSLQLALQELEAAMDGGTRVFLLGASIHYMALAVRKTREGNYTVVYVDPQNNPILGKTEPELQATMAKMEFRSWIEAGWQRDKIERLCMDTFNGVIMLVNVLASSLLRGDSNIFAPFLKLNFVSGFLKSYTDAVGNWPSPETSGDEREGESKKQKAEERTIIVKRLFGSDKVIQLDSSATAEGFLSRFQLWSSTLYPPAVIDSNISGALQKLMKLGHSLLQKKDILEPIFAWAMETQIALEKAHSQVKSPASIENGKLQAFCTRMHKSLDQLRSICQCYNNKESTSHR
mmetsp:Transcript_30163/g.42040  ORF Transcript_30163/g.42040 Transcript_30163/m.42040 type:complete len:398 (-) Transcript_30163:166-1359(-)